MSYTESSTYEISYTIADIGRVFDCFAADLDGIAQSTLLLDHDYVKRICNDLKLMAQHKYLAEVNIVLRGPTGKEIRANKYEVLTEAGQLTAAQPGNFLWPRIVGGRLSVVAIYSEAWKTLPDWRKESFRKELRLDWVTSDIDTSFPGLVSTIDRAYVSSGYGLRKSVYR